MGFDLVPTIDVSAPTVPMLGALDDACRDHGFFLVAGHGLDELIARTWAMTREFFESDRANKLDVSRTAEHQLGYFDRELTKRRRDHKEVFDFTDPRTPWGEKKNRWPNEPADFRPGMEDFYDAFSVLALRLTSVVKTALGLDPHRSAAVLGDRATSAVRLNHYPVGDPVPAIERHGLPALGDTALGHHTDPGTLTLLLQDDAGGLQARSADGSWVDIEPRPGTIVVNLADATQVWTNDRYVAAVHRVLPMDRTDRMSIPYFLNPPRGTVVEPIADLAGDRPKYRPFLWSDYMKARTDDNFEDLGVDDAQITDFLVR